MTNHVDFIDGRSFRKQPPEDWHRWGDNSEKMARWIDLGPDLFRGYFGENVGWMLEHAVGQHYEPVPKTIYFPPWKEGPHASTSQPLTWFRKRPLSYDQGTELCALVSKLLVDLLNTEMRDTKDALKELTKRHARDTNAFYELRTKVESLIADLAHEFRADERS